MIDRGRARRAARWVAQWALLGGVAFYASEKWPALMQARDGFAQLVSSSFMAPLVRMGERAYSAIDLLEVPLLLVALWIGVSLSMRVVRGQVARVFGLPGGAETALGLLRYALTGVGAIVVLQASGFDVSSLAIFGGVLGVGIGFGLQNITSNFVSGVLLSFERPIKPGDYVSLGELSGTVLRIGARATQIQTPDHVTIVVPNSRFLEAEVVNWSHGDPLCKLHAPVGVAYGSDVARVRQALLEAARGAPKVLADPRPSADLEGFGDSALLFDLEVWTRSPQDQNEILSALRYRIEASLRRHAIEIPFPQRDLRLRSPELERALDAWTRREFPEPTRAATAASPTVPSPLDLAFSSEMDRAPDLWTDAEIETLAQRMRAPGGVAIGDRRHRLSVYPRCLVGAEAVRWMVDVIGATHSEAIALGRRLVAQKLLHHVLDEHDFEDAPLFYRFRADET